MTWVVKDLEGLARLFMQNGENAIHRVKNATRFRLTKKEEALLHREAGIWTLAAQTVRDTVIEPTLGNPQPVATVQPNSQQWKGMDGAIAYQLIERHANNWADIGLMMHEWLEANGGKL